MEAAESFGSRHRGISGHIGRPSAIDGDGGHHGVVAFEVSGVRESRAVGRELGHKSIEEHSIGTEAGAFQDAFGHGEVSGTGAAAHIRGTLTINGYRSRRFTAGASKEGRGNEVRSGRVA